MNMNIGYFLYKNKKYSFEFPLFKKYSDYISREYGENLGEKTNCIYLLNEFDHCMDLSEDSIDTFIHFCQKQNYFLTISNVISVNYLSQKYEVPSLVKITEKYIKKHHKEIIDDFLTAIQDKPESDPIFNSYEKILSDHISSYFTDKRLLSIPIASLYRILIEFSKQEISDEKEKEIIECQLIRFLIKYIKRHGAHASILFSIVNIGYKGCLLLNEKLSKHADLVDFNYVNSTIFRSLNYMKIKQEKMKEKNKKKRRNKIEKLCSNCVEIINDFFHMEKFKENMNEDEIKSISFLKYGLLYSVRSIFKNNKKTSKSIQKKVESSFLNREEINNDQLKMSKFDLLNYLLKENAFFKGSSILNENKKYIDIISLISTIIKEMKKESIISLFKSIEQDNEIIDFVDKSFPYFYIKNSKISRLNIWINIMKILIKNNICFSIEIDGIKFNFNSSSNLDFKVKLITDIESSLLISEGSEIRYEKNMKSFDLWPNNITVIYDFIWKLATKKMKTAQPMKARQILDIYLLNAHIKFKNKRNMDSFSDSFLSIKDLFNENDSSIICMVWNLVFNLSEIEILELSTIINPFESNLLITAQKLFKSASFAFAEEILFWSKWACKIDMFIPTIVNCLLNNDSEDINYNLSQIDSLIESLTSTINYLKKPLCIFWSSTYWIEICQNKCNRLKELRNKKAEISFQIHDIIQHLIDAQINKEFIEIKEKIIDIMNEQHLTNENCLRIKELFDCFIDEATSKNDKEEKAVIKWPQIEFYQNKGSNDNIKVLKTLLNYSKIRKILDELKVNKNVFENLRLLTKCPKIYGSWKLLLTFLIKSSNLNDFKNAVNDSICILDANTIVELFNINMQLITDPNYLFNLVNDYSKRHSRNDNEIKWIYQQMNEYSADLLLTIPKFNPKSIIFLIVSKRNDNTLKPAPFFINIADLNLQMLEERSLLDCEFDSFRHAVMSIVQTLYNKDEIPPQKYQDLKINIRKKLFLKGYKFETVNRIKTLFVIAESLDKWKKQKYFDFEDTFFLSTKQLFDENILYNKYPSLFLWICKNKSCAMHLRSLYQNFSGSHEGIPFWLLCFRILSSKQNIKIESNSNNNNNIYKIINDATSSTIISFFEKNVELKKPFHFDWINLLISNPPHQIANNNIQMIRVFLNNLSNDSLGKNEDMLTNNIKDSIYNTISELTLLILSNKASDLLQKNIEKISIIQFLFSPSKYLITEINRNLKKQKIDELFDENYDIFDISEINYSLNNDVSFSSINKLKQLSMPVLFCSSDKKILSSLKKIKCNINPICPSCSLDSSISIYLTSFIDKKAKVSIENLINPQHSEIISTQEKLGRKEAVKIFINPPKTESKEETFLIIKGNIKLKVKEFDELILPFKIKMMLLPLKFRLRCIQYQLSINNDKNKIKLECSHAKSNETIDFEVINYYLNDLFLLDVDLIPRKYNEADKPIVNINNETKQISLKLPIVSEIKICHFDLILKFCNTFEARIRCEIVILPLVFSFEIYDYCEKEFISDSCQVCLLKPDCLQHIFCRISSLCASLQKCRISYKLPSSIKIESADVESLDEFYANIKNNDDNYFINNYFIFSIVIRNTEFPVEIDNEDNYFITLEINGTQQTIKLEFIDPFNEHLNIEDKMRNEELNNDYLNKYPCYFYQSENNKWNKIENNENIPMKNENSAFSYIIATPFKSYSNIDKSVQVNYNSIDENFVTTTNKSVFNVKYLKISLETNDVKISDSAECETIKKTDNIIYRLINPNSNVTKYYSIFGFVENDPENWFPVFNDYKSIQYKPVLICDISNLGTAKTCFSEICGLYPSENQFSNLMSCAVLLEFLKEKDFVLKFPSIVTYFPKCLQNKFEQILSDIKKYTNEGTEIPEDIKFILNYNLALVFLRTFENRYEEIKSHQFCLYMPLTEEKIHLQMNEAFNEFIHNDLNIVKNKQLNNSELIGEALKSNFSRVVDVSRLTKCECVIINEYDIPRPSKLNDELKNIVFDEKYNENSLIKITCKSFYELPQIKFFKLQSISNYLEFISACTEGANLFPAFILKCLTSGIGLDIAEEYFEYLLAVYQTANSDLSENKSIISSYINSFIESFEICVDRLKSAGFEFDISSDETSYNFHELIYIPKYIKPQIPQSEWIKTENH